jgi:AmmeMemoRadiSam system protein A
MNQYVLLAKTALEEYVKQGKIIKPLASLPENFFKEKHGVFITIEKQGKLRACLGTYLPTKPNIVQEIINNAISAATKDNRFDPINEQELDQLSYSVSVLEYPELVKDLKTINPKKFGIIVKTAPFVFPEKNKDNQEFDFTKQAYFKTGLLLPDLDGIDNSEEQFKIACQKAGIDPEKEKVFIYKFKVNKFE